jgi:DNA excision repair protein ERCC-6
MPGKVEQVLFCKLSIRQRRMYEAYLESDEVQHILRNRGTTQSFRPIITLRKICNHPHLLVGSDPAAYDSFLKNGQIGDVDDYSSDEDSVIDDIGNEDSIVEGSGKLEVLAKILPLWKKQGHRFLIFSQWKKTLDIIQHFLNSMGWNFGRMDGNTNVAGRQKVSENLFQMQSLIQSAHI